MWVRSLYVLRRWRLGGPADRDSCVIVSEVQSGLEAWQGARRREPPRQLEWRQLQQPVRGDQAEGDSCAIVSVAQSGLQAWSRRGGGHDLCQGHMPLVVPLARLVPLALLAPAVAAPAPQQEVEEQKEASQTAKESPAAGQVPKDDGQQQEQDSKEQQVEEWPSRIDLHVPRKFKEEQLDIEELGRQYSIEVIVDRKKGLILKGRKA